MAAEVAAWTAICFAVWLATLSSVTWQDAALAAGGSLLAGGCAVGGRRLTHDRWRPRPAWLRWLIVLPIAVVGDTAAVLATAYRLRRPAESQRTYRLPTDEADPTSFTRAALGALALSAAPASYVVDTDTDTDTDSDSQARVLHVTTAGTVTPRWARVNPTDP